MIQTASGKQVEYIASLKRELLQAPGEYASKRDIAKRAIETALALRLPDPADARDASAQIDALKASIVGYYETRREAYMAVASRLAAAAGRDGSGLRQDVRRRGLTGDERRADDAAWVAYIESLLA